MRVSRSLCAVAILCSANGVRRITRERVSVAGSSDAESAGLSAGFTDLGAGCCSEFNDKSIRLFSGALDEGGAEACQQKCIDEAEAQQKECGFAISGWNGGSSTWCVAITTSATCSSLNTSASACGSGGHNGVQTFKADDGKESPPAPPAPPANVPLGIQAVLNEINSKRQTPLCFNAKLMAAADEHVSLMVQAVDLHPDDASTFDFLNRNEWRALYEIKAYDPMESPAVDVVKDWLTKPRWLDAMKNETYQSAGFAFRSFMGAGTFHTLVLGKPVENVEACD